MTSDELLSKLHQQNVRDAQDRKAWEETLKEVDALQAQARRVTSFREYYCWWLKNTREGREIKAKLLSAQSGKCFKCKGLLRIPGSDGVSIDHSEIHHLAPLALLQRYLEAKQQIKWSALSVFVTSEQYLSLVHPLCNKQLGEQVGDLPNLQFLKDFLLENE
ncbi:hypothetical protein AB3R30_18255 [Leptolyngbyaceae cyanobacterium UHCC 1019]